MNEGTPLGGRKKAADRIHFEQQGVILPHSKAVG